jgi:hypothetical protein
MTLIPSPISAGFEAFLIINSFFLSTKIDAVFGSGQIKWLVSFVLPQPVRNRPVAPAHNMPSGVKTILVFLLSLTIGLVLPNPTWAHGGGGGGGGGGSGGGGGWWRGRQQ